MKALIILGFCVLSFLALCKLMTAAGAFALPIAIYFAIKS